jgi:hypothetical protein
LDSFELEISVQQRIHEACLVVQRASAFAAPKESIQSKTVQNVLCELLMFIKLILLLFFEKGQPKIKLRKQSLKL